MNNFVKSLFVLILFSFPMWLLADEAEAKEADTPADAVAVQPTEQNPSSESKPAEAEKDKRGFVFGSYGRVQPATDLRGGSPKWVNIVGHGSRLEQETSFRK